MKEPVRSDALRRYSWNQKVTVTAFGLLAIALLVAGCPTPGGGRELSSAKAITAYSFASPPATGTIDENAKTIAVTVPYGTNVTALMATFTTTGSRVKVGSTVQVSGSTGNNFTSPVIYTVTAADGSTASYAVTVTVALSSAKAITAFSFANPPATGTIDENAKTIVVTVPYGTNVTALVAAFTTTGSAVKVGSAVQVSGATANDFTSPVVYTLTAADGSTASYTMTVIVASSSTKAITAFSFASPAATGTIDENAKSIAVTVPYGTDVTALVAMFTTTGASIEIGSTVQVSGTNANNFTNPVTYAVTAADGSTASYTVTVTVTPPSSIKAITAFSFASPPATGTIDENAKNIALAVPYGTDVTALVATFATTGASVRVNSKVQVSGTTSNNFTSPVVYTVMAQDGSTASYTVTVTVALSSAKAITAFSFASPAAPGVIDENAKTITVTVPYGTDVTALLAIFTSTGSNVNVSFTMQVSGVTANNFTSPVNYTVTAQDGSTASYTVTVTVTPPSSTKTITAFSFTRSQAPATIDENAKTIAVTVSYGTDVTALVATFTTTGLSVKVGSTVQVSGVTANNFTSPVIYTVTAQDGSTGSYSVTVTVNLWHTVGAAGFSAGQAQYISLAIDQYSGTPFVAYQDLTNSFKATLMTYTGGLWQTLGSSAAGAAWISLGTNGVDDVWVAYVADLLGYGGPAIVDNYRSGVYSTGTRGISAGNVYNMSLAMDGALPYVAFSDGANSGKATVMGGTAWPWQTVGTAGFSAGRADLDTTSLAIDSSGTAYVAYRDVANSLKVTVMKYAGGSWQTVGMAGFSAGGALYKSLAIDRTGTPYVAYRDAGNSYKATVMKYAGGSWQTVGTAGFSAGQADYITLALDLSGTPYVAYKDYANGNKATVMKYAGGSWETVGTAGFSVGPAGYVSLAIDKYSGTPYLAYEDGGNNNKITVMRFK